MVVVNDGGNGGGKKKIKEIEGKLGIGQRKGCGERG